ncbi:MAG: sel1 repeat family protein [Clostridiales bacterium]|nr:sel1 repeat family protein [Clostridiales bacterium]MDY5976483.1 tetratricopeptide repeat protein [Anaerovoracaceae bacterium]
MIDIDELRIRADRGDTAAAVEIASYYIDGSIEAPSDEAVARIKDYLADAVDKGNGRAMRIVGDMYARGMFVESDYDRARFFYDKAKSLGDSDADDRIHALDMRNRDYEAEIVAFSKAAEEGDPAGYIGLGDLHIEGTYIERNPSDAFEYYSKAYEMALEDKTKKSYPDACMRMGNAYARGEGTMDSMRMARMYFLEAIEGYRTLSELGDKECAESLKDAENALNEAMKVLCSRCYGGR